jgi:uncharacterized protein
MTTRPRRVPNAAREKTRFDFPCRYPIKALGPAGEDFLALVLEIVGRHAPDLDPTAASVRVSRGGKWHAVTVVIEAQSRAQVDAIYRDLTAHEQVVWAL